MRLLPREFRLQRSYLVKVLRSELGQLVSHGRVWASGAYLWVPQQLRELDGDDIGFVHGGG